MYTIKTNTVDGKSEVFIMQELENALSALRDADNKANKVSAPVIE